MFEMVNHKRVLVQMSHVAGKLHEVKISEGLVAQRILESFHVTNPADYGRLMHYGQCRLSSKISQNLKKFFFILPEIDWETIGTMVNKELDKHRPKPYHEIPNLPPEHSDNPHPGEWHYKYDCQHCGNPY